MPEVATSAEGGGVIRYFRLANKDTLQWSGDNIDATPSGLGVISVRKPQNINVQEPDTQTQSGYITINYGTDFHLVLTQASRLETGVDIIRRLMALPGVASGGGARGVAGEIARLIRDLISRVRVAITAQATADLYRTAQDGGGTIVVLATARTTVDGELDPDDMGGVTFKATTRMEGGVQGPIPNTETPDSRQETSGAGQGLNLNFTIGDSAYIKLAPVGHKAVTVAITLEADLQPVIDQAGLNKFIDEIQAKLRQFGVVQNVPGGGENVNPPQQQPGQDQADYFIAVANFGAQLLGAFQAVLNAVLDSVKRRVIGALVTQTVWSFEFAEVVPPEVRQQLQLAHAPAAAEKPYADAVIEVRPSTTSGEPGKSVRVIQPGKLAPELMPFIERMVVGQLLDEDERMAVAAAFPRAIEAELSRYSTAELREVVAKYRPLFQLPKEVDLSRLTKKQLISSFRLRELESV